MTFTDIAGNQSQSYIAAYLNYLRSNPTSVSQTGENTNLLDLLKLQQNLQEKNNATNLSDSVTSEKASGSTDSDVLESLKQLIDLISQLIGKDEKPEKKKDDEEINVAKIEQEANGFAQSAESEAAGAMFSLNLISSFPPGSESAVGFAQASITGVSNVQSCIAKIQSMEQVGSVPEALGRAENALSFAVDVAAQAARYAGISFRSGLQVNLIA